MTDKVYIFPRHKFVRCKEDCPGCCLCEGGLGLCDTCGAGESQLTTDCPGRRMTYDERDRVTAGVLNYRFGVGWVEESVRGTHPFGEKQKVR